LPWEITRDEHGKLVRVPVKKPFFSQIKISRRTALAGLFALLIWTLVGVGAWKLSKGVFGPRAPSLRDEPVFQDAKAGLRFLVPDGWNTSSKTIYQPESTSQERSLVEYGKISNDQLASFEVTFADLPPSTDLGAYLSGPSLGQTRWNLTANATPLTVDGVEAQRFILAAGEGPGQTTKEVVVFRRGERVFFFTGLFPSSDNESRQQIRRAVESIVWKN
jgi:hypothetical protein